MWVLKTTCSVYSVVPPWALSKGRGGCCGCLPRRPCQQVAPQSHNPQSSKHKSPIVALVVVVVVGVFHLANIIPTQVKEVIQIRTPAIHSIRAGWGVRACDRSAPWRQPVLLSAVSDAAAATLMAMMDEGALCTHTHHAAGQQMAQIEFLHQSAALLAWSPCM